MKIKESDLKRLIQESMQELSLEALEQELDEVAPGIEQDILQGPGMNKKKSAGASGWSRDAISAINPTKAPGSNLRGSDTQKALAGLGRMAQGEEDAMVYEQEEELEEQAGSNRRNAQAARNKMSRGDVMGRDFSVPQDTKVQRELEDVGLKPDQIADNMAQRGLGYQFKAKSNMTDRWDTIKEEELEEGWGLSGGIGGSGPRSTGLTGGKAGASAAGGGSRFMNQFKSMVAAASKGNQQAMKNVESMAKANPGNKEMQDGLKQAQLGAKKSDWNQFFAANPVKTQDKSNPFGLTSEGKVRKIIAGLVKEVLAESAQKKNKKPVSKKK